MSQPPKRNIESLLKEAQRAARQPPSRNGRTPPARSPAPAAAPAPAQADPNTIELDEPAAKAPRRSLPARGPTARVNPTHQQPAGAPAVSSVAAVKKMQEAILNFASVASANDVTSMTGNQQGQQTGNQSRQISDQTQNDKEHLGGNDPFGDFLVQQYVASDPSGKQYLNTDVSGKKNRADASIDDSNLRGMIDTISRVGTPGVNGGEKSVDGVWAHRTDNALAGIVMLTNAMLSFARELKVPVTYTQQELDTFKGLVPKVYTQIQDKGETANELTPHINAAANFFQELKKAVLNKKEFRQYIDQKKPFVSYQKESKKSPKEVLSPTELSAFNTNQVLPLPNVGFVGPNEKNNSISLRELSDMESFKGFMKRIGKGKEAENPAEVKKMLDTVMQQLSASDVTPSSKGAGY